MPRLLQNLLRFAALALLLSGCATRYIQRSAGVPYALKPDQVPMAIEKAEAALIDDKPQVALDWMRIATVQKGLPTEQRRKIQRLLEVSADRFIKTVSESNESAEILAEVLDLDLPRQIAVTGAIAGANKYMDRKAYQQAVLLIQRIDKRFPSHHLRSEAGEILLKAGLTLADLDSGWLDSYRDHGLAALEYVSINYPTTNGGELALQKLGEMYEEDGRWELAISRHEELTQNFPSSSLVATSLARIPHLRLASIESPEYDRKAIINARVDLERWLTDYAGHPATDQVKFDLRDSLIRLAESDLVISDFHETIDNDFGARYHAERALDEALLAEDPKRVARAQKILARFPPNDMDTSPSAPSAGETP
jgi:tetratricopeptide (TPR) repeat protein